MDLHCIIKPTKYQYVVGGTSQIMPTALTKMVSKFAKEKMFKRKTKNTLSFFCSPVLPRCLYNKDVDIFEVFCFSGGWSLCFKCHPIGVATVVAPHQVGSFLGQCRFHFTIYGSFQLQ
jgi:hypothetical protein